MSQTACTAPASAARRGHRLRQRESARRSLLTALLLFVAWGLAPPAQAQDAGRITGRVSEAGSAAPLADVQVFLVGVEIGATTRQTGQYLMANVPPGTYEIRAERIGLAPLTRQITVTAGQTLEEDFELQAQALGLDEIVVTGTAGAARRREVGNSIAQINTVDLPDRPTSVHDMLTAMAPGVDVTNYGGGETGQGSNITIRGINSINNNSPPIIFIDGIRIMNSRLPNVGGASNQPTALDQLNPNDIERIEVISGPAASTLYGTEATAGVIQVFTRQGTSRAPQWQAEVQQGTLWTQKFGANGQDYIHMDPWICTGPFQCGELNHLPHTQSYSASVRGGAQALQYFVSGGHNRELGATPEDALKRWNVRGNVTLNPLEDVLLTWNTAYSNTWQQNGATGNYASGLTLNVFRQDQNYFGTGDPEIVNSTLDWENERTIERFTTGGTVRYTPLANLTNRFTVGYDFTQQEGRNVQPFGFIPQPEGRMTVSTVSRRFLSFDYVGTFSFDVVPDLRSSFSWGGQATGDFRATVSGTGRDFPGAAMPTLSSASETTSSESRQKVWNSGFFLQNILAMSDRYFLTLGLRVDGNSTFGKNFNLAMYPKASWSWVVSDEGFWSPGLGELKLRGAWGRSGRAPGAFIAQRTWSNSGLDGEAAFVPGNLGNPDIGPEVTTEVELGFDASWMRDRIRPRFTYYNQVTRDAIQSLSSIPSLGFTSSVQFNIGKVQNLGQEYALDLTAFRARNWGWDVGANLSRNRNEVLEWLGTDDPESESRIGRPISYSTWTMYQHGEGMGTSRHSASGTYTTQSCEVNATDPETGETIRVPRTGLDPTIHACSFSSTEVFGYPMARPTTIVSGNTTFRMPHGIRVSARGDWRGGGGWISTNPIPIGRNVRSPVCLPYYINDVDNQISHDTPAIWVRRCRQGTSSAYRHERDEFKLRSVSLNVPVDFAFPERVQGASLTVVLDNAITWNESMWGVFSRTSTGGGERIPQSTTLRASLLINF